MRKFVYLAFMLTAVTNVMAQSLDYRPMLKEGKVWKEQSYNVIYLSDIEKRIVGDTIVDGERYFKLLIKTVSYKHDIDANGTETYTKQYERTGYRLLQEYDRKVYRLNGGKKQLLYDFNLAVGDSHGNQTVTKIDTIAVGDNLFRRFWIEEINKEMYQILVDHGESPEKYESTWKKEGYWVEGVGSNCGLEHSSGWTNPGGKNELISFYEDGVCIFTAEDFFAPAWKDETVSVKDIRNSSTVTQSSVFYDLQGRRLSGKPGKGVYIENGKKRLVK